MKLIVLSFASAVMSGAAFAETTAGLEAYLARVEAAEASFGAACGDMRAAAPPEGRVWLRLGGKGIEIVPADPGAAEAAAFWAEAALGARAAAEQLYGRAVGAALSDAPVMIETGPAGVTVHDGKAMALGDPCDALERIVAALGDGAPGDPFAAARAAAASAETVALPVGGAATARLGDLPPGATARGPDGVSARIIETDEGPQLALSAGADARPGASEARIYGPGDKFRPIEVVPLAILPGAAAVQAAPGGALGPGGRREGDLRVGAEDVVEVVISEATRLRFASEGDADLSAVLESAAGDRIGGDDDSGEGYGFAFSADLPPGRYTLKLRHCCGGGGRYAVTAAPE